MTQSSALKYPKKSHRKKVVLPKNSAKLAEFFGIMMGDGGIGNPWQAVITVNALADKSYAQYISQLCADLFEIKPSVVKRKTREALVIRISSTTIVDFLVHKGLIRGNKLEKGLRIPQWVLTSSQYRKACVRGLMDTDGCLFVHRHKVLGKQYKNIGLTFTSHSPELIRQVATIFEEFAIIPHITKRGKDIYLYKASDVLKYLRVFGTSNECIGNVYKKWKKEKGGVG